jgi:hypothetical protein
MISNRDTYLMALARRAEIDRKANRNGSASLLNSGLTVTDRIREAEHRVRRMLADSQQGIWPTLPVIFDAMAELAVTAQLVYAAGTQESKFGDNVA